MSKTSVIILHFNSRDDTLKCLQSLLKEQIRNEYFSIIIVFNSVDPSLVSFLRKKHPEVFLLENPENIGFAGGVNRGIKKAIESGSDNIIILNNDTIVAKGLVSRLVTYASRDKSIGLVSPKIYFSPGSEYHKNRYKLQEKGKVIWYAGGIIDWSNIYGQHKGVDEVDHGQYNIITETDFATGCCMLVKKSVIDKTGYFDEKYFLYFEDVDYSVRAKDKGFKVMYYPDACLWHKNASSSGKPGSPTHVYYQNRNRLYFGFRYAPWKTKRALAVDSLKMIFKGSIPSKSVIDYYFGRMGKRII